jgi:adenylate cyclase, class 2
MELEVKILDINIENIRRIMKENGGVLVKNEMQENYIHDFPDRRLLDKKGYARIRVVKDQETGKETVFLTIKKLLSREVYKKMEEYETIIENKEVGLGILSSLGLELIQNIRKSRESYQYKNTLVEIDVNDKEFVPFPYLEVESPSEEELEEVVKLLGYSMEDTSSLSIHEILEARGLKPKSSEGL